MTTLAIDLAVIATIAFCGWRGYKNGLIRGVFGVVTLIVSLFIANIAANAYSQDFTGMLKPFVSGVVEKALTDIAEGAIDDTPGGLTNGTPGGLTNGTPSGLTNGTPSGLENQFDSEEFGKAYSALRLIGLSESAAMRVAESTLAPESKEGVDEEGAEGGGGPAGATEDAAPGDEGSGVRVTLWDMIADKLSDSLAYVAVFAVAFILMAIIFAVLGNIISFVFSLPGLKLVDIIAGAALGLVKGLILVLALTAVIRYFGLVVPEIIEETSVLKYFINNNLIADLLGI